MSQINAAEVRLGYARVMREAIRIDLDELAELREKAALLCEETNGLIEDYRRLKKWRDELRSTLSTKFIPLPESRSITVPSQPAEKLVVGAEVD